MKVKKIISETAVIHGRGSDPYKWVSGLTKSERETVRREARRIRLISSVRDGKIYDAALPGFRVPTLEETALMQSEETVVLIRDIEAHHYTQSGWKYVIYNYGRYQHREY